jgi:hypothetical protein
MRGSTVIAAKLLYVSPAVTSDAKLYSVETSAENTISGVGDRLTPSNLDFLSESK